MTCQIRIYSVYGLVIRTNAPLGDLLLPHVGPPDLEYIISSAETATTWGEAERVCESIETDSAGNPKFVAWRHGSNIRLRFSEIATFDVTPVAILCHPFAGVSEETLTHCFLGDILSLWLELHEIPALHASSVVMNGKAVGFLSHSGNGKSTLAAGFVQDGYDLLTDDILAVQIIDDQVLARPGYPRIRLWPNEAHRFFGESEILKRVYPGIDKRWIPVGDGFGTFCRSPRPLVCLYVLARDDSDPGDRGIRITPISSRDAVIELVRYSFGGFVIEGLGLAAKRMDLVARVVKQVPVRRITFAPGTQFVSRVQHALWEDVKVLAD